MFFFKSFWRGSVFRGNILAAIMLFGKDDVILNACPAYVTDALVRRFDQDRYDDREVIKTNLIESYEQLLDFGRKHLPDKFYLEDGVYRKSLRSTIIREMIGNTLIHREFTSSHVAKFVIEKDRMYIENANRAVREGVITPDNLEPNPKNPLIAAVFRNIGFADQLGSGVRNLFKYSRFYSGKDPEFQEGDVFRIIVPLDEQLLYKLKNADKMPIDADDMLIDTGDIVLSIEKMILSDREKRVLTYALAYHYITSDKAAELLGVKQRRAREILKKLVDAKLLEKRGSYKNTIYIAQASDGC